MLVIIYQYLIQQLFIKICSKAKKIIVNIDEDQLKNLNVKFDLKINMDCKEYLKKIIGRIKKKKNNYLLKFKKLNWYDQLKKNYQTQTHLLES